MFVQHVPQMIVWVEIWGIWRPPQTCCCAPQTVPEPSVLHGKTHYPADGSHSHQGILFPSRPILNTIFCLLSIRTRTLCQQSELQQLRFGPQSQPSLPTCINEPWPPMTLSLVLSVVSFWPLLIKTDHSTPGTPYESCSFSDVLTRSSSLTVQPFSNSFKSLHLNFSFTST